MFLRKNRGFSLLELLIIILIISILIAVAIPNFFDFQLRSKRTKAREDIDIFINAISLFEQEEGKALWDFARETALAFTVNDTTILGFLVGPYLKKLPTDPWGYQYVCDPEVDYVLSRGANGVENSADILGDQDIKIFFGSSVLTIKDAIYIDVDNDGVTLNDKVIVYFTQTIAVSGLDLAGDSPLNNDQEAGVDSDPATPYTPIAGVGDAVWFTTRDATGGSSADMVGADVTVIEDYLQTTAIAVDTRLIVMTLAATATISTTVESNLKNNGYVNLTAAGATALHACDLDAAGAEVFGVVNPGLGVRVRKP